MIYPAFASCGAKHDFNFKSSEKRLSIDEVRSVVRHAVLKRELMDNSIIDRMHFQPYSGKGLYAKLSGWCQRTVTKEILEAAIAEKEDRVDSYIQKTGIEQWLLLVIGGTGATSYEMDINIDTQVNTRFSKVFLIEDFRNVAYELK